jgi:hypothetical protein
MHCTLFIPGLMWPRPGAHEVARGLEIPALCKLLARGQAQRCAAIAPEGWLCQAFEVERAQDWPIAPLTLELDGGKPGDAYWLRADPIHIKVERRRLLLVESAIFEVGAEEAQALAAALNAHFAADGYAFSAPHPKRWYVKLPRPPRLVTHSVSEAAGRDVQSCLPEGPDALAWHRVFNEAQMLLHGHPANQAREERGEPAINSVWLWGGGTRPPVRGRPYDAVWSDDAVASALAAAAGAAADALPVDAAAWIAKVEGAARDSGLLVLDAAASAAAYGDVEAWRNRLSALEALWLAPLLRELHGGRLEAIAIVVPGPEAGYRFEVTRADLYKVWRPVKPLSAYA